MLNIEKNIFSFSSFNSLLKIFCILFVPFSLEEFIEKKFTEINLLQISPNFIIYLFFFLFVYGFWGGFFFENNFVLRGDFYFHSAKSKKKKISIIVNNFFKLIFFFLVFFKILFPTFLSFFQNSSLIITENYWAFTEAFDQLVNCFILCCVIIQIPLFFYFLQITEKLEQYIQSFFSVIIFLALFIGAWVSSSIDVSTQLMVTSIIIIAYYALIYATKNKSVCKYLGVNFLN